MPKKSTTKIQPNDQVEPVKPATLQITQCQVFALKEPAGKTRALARIVLNDQFQLTGLRVVDGANGLFVSYPNDPGYRGDDYRSLFYPITKELRDHIEETVLVKYQAVLAGEG